MMAEEYAAFDPTSQLTFTKLKDEGDYTQPHITITNKSNTDALLFRIQTTSPLSYRVRPSHGRIGPSESIDIQVIMVANSRKIDKFLIKCAPIASTVTGDFTELFTSVESLAKDHRLKCAIIGGEEMEVTALTTGAPIGTNGTGDTGIGALTPPSQGLGGGSEKSALERSTSSLNIPGQTTSSPYHEPSIASHDSEEHLQKELSHTKQQLRELATRNQELSQRLAAVEQSGVRLRDIAGASAKDRSPSPSQHSSKDALNILASTINQEYTILNTTIEYYNWANAELEGVIPMALITPVLLIGMCLFAFILGAVFFSK